MTREYVVPGRVEVVGKHVDYAGGRSITCAVDRAIHATATTLTEPLVRIRSEGQGGGIEVPLSGTADASTGDPHWGTYARAVARRFARDFPQARRGVELSLRSDLPASAGLSSSTAFVVAIGMALVDANEMENDARWRELMPDTLARAEYFSAMETGAAFASLPGDEGVGVRGGGQDHVAVMCAEAGQLSQFSYLPARLERRIEWPSDHVIAIGVSGVEATKTRNARAQYNRASDATRAIVAEWNRLSHRSDLTLANAFRSSDDAPRQLELIAETDIGPFTATYLTRRLAQFRQEIEVIVPDAGDALRHGDLTWFGSIVDRSQSLAEIALENQVPETVHLQWAARKCGAVAASAFGAGFGGAVWAMVRADNAQDFLAVWRENYVTRFPDRAAASQWLLTRPSSGARVVSS